MSNFKDLTSNRPATMAAVLKAIARLRHLDETQIQQLAAEGKLRDHFAFAEDVTLPEDFVEEDEIPEASPLRTSTGDQRVPRKGAAAVEEESRDRVAITDSFIREHYSHFTSLLTRHTRNSAVAAEMVNEAFAITISHLRVGQIAEPELLTKYVYRVALNLYRNYRLTFDSRAGLRPEEVLSQRELEAMLIKMPRSKSEALRLHHAAEDKGSFGENDD